MYVVNFNECIELDTLQNFLNDIKKIGAPGLFLTTLNLDFSTLDILEKLKIVDIVTVDDALLCTFDLDNVDSLIYDYILDLIDTHKHTVVRYSKEMSPVLKRFMDMCAESGYSNISCVCDGNFVLPRTIDDLTVYDEACIFEVFNVPCNIPHISHQVMDGMLSFTCDTDATCIGMCGEMKGSNRASHNIVADILNLTALESTYLADLLNFDLARIIDGFNTNFYTPAGLFVTGTLLEKALKVINYKYAVFDVVSNITPYDYPKLPKSIVDLLNNMNYIGLNQILQELDKNIEII